MTLPSTTVGARLARLDAATDAPGARLATPSSCTSIVRVKVRPAVKPSPAASVPVIVWVPRSANDVALQVTATSEMAPSTSTGTASGRVAPKSSPGATWSGTPSSITRQISVPVPLSSQ